MSSHATAGPAAFRPSAAPVLLAAALILLATPALAHPVQGVAVGFSTGFLHPLTGPDHVVAMVAVGMWGAVLGAPAIWLLPIVFPLVMAFGGVLGVLGMPLPGVEIGVALSAIGLGAAVAFAARPPLWVAAVLVGGVRDLSRLFPRRRAAEGGRSGRLQHRLRARDRAAPPVRHQLRPPGPLADRRAGGAGDRRPDRLRRHLFPDRHLRPRRAMPAMVALILVFVLAWPGPALAHSLIPSFGDFYGGLLHPATALDLAPPLVALGLLSGQNGKAIARRMLIVLPAVFVLATDLGGALPPPAHLAVVNAGSFVVLGLLLALDAALPQALVLGLGVALGLCAGLANGSGMAGGSDPALFLLGSALAGLAAILLPSAVVVSLAPGWQRIAVRVVGSWLAAAGAMVLALPQRALFG